jgi:hypothetical protein
MIGTGVVVVKRKFAVNTCVWRKNKNWDVT